MMPIIPAIRHKTWHQTAHKTAKTPATHIVIVRAQRGSNGRLAVQHLLFLVEVDADNQQADDHDESQCNTDPNANAGC